MTVDYVRVYKPAPEVVVTPLSGNPNGYNLSMDNTYPNYTYLWQAYQSDASASLGPEVGTLQWGDQYIYEGTYAGHISSGQYILLKHGVWSPCSNWMETITHIHLNCSIQGGGGGGTGKTDARIISESTSHLAKEPVVPAVYIAPNPNRGTFRIEVVFDEKVDFNVTIYDPVGRKVYDRPIRQASRSVLHPDLSMQAEGVYVVHVSSKAHRETRKLVITD